MSGQFDPYHVWLGIPPDESAKGGPNHYRLLGLQLWEADRDVISNALDQRLAYLRTLQTGKRSAQSQKLSNEVSAAGGILLDAKKKLAYDEKLRAQRAAEKPAVPVSRPAAAFNQTALPTARALDERPQHASAVVPFPAHANYQVPAPAPPPSLPPHVEQIPIALATEVAPISVSSSGSSAVRSRGSGGGLAIALVGGCALALAVVVGVVAWKMGVLQLPAGSDLVATVPDVPAVPPIDPQPSPATPPVAPTPSGTDPVTVVPSPAVPAPVAVDPSDKRQVWVYADNARGAFRHIAADRWVELAEKEAVWYRQIASSTDAVHLEQLGGSPTHVRLLENRLEKDNPELTGATSFYGKWRSLEGAPPFARRDPGPERPLPPPDASARLHGLLFDGQSHLELPLPEALAGGGQPFTIEMWVRWSEPRPDSCLLQCGDLRLATVASAPGHPAEAVTLSCGDRVLTFGIPLAPGKFHHLAILGDGQNMTLAINGMIDPQARLPGPMALGKGPLRVGLDAKGQVGLRGILRGLRISDFNRYPASMNAASLPRLLAADDRTLLAVDFRAPAGDEVPLLGSVADDGRRIGAQWVQLGPSGEYVAQTGPARIDLMRLFMASRHTLEGQTFHTANMLQLKSPRGRTALLVPHLPPANYQFETLVTRGGGDGGLAIGLVLEREPAMLLIDAGPGSAKSTGLLTDGDKVLPGIALPPPNAIAGPLLPIGTTHKVTCDVQTHQGTAQVRLLVDGRMTYAWTGAVQSAPLPTPWQLPCRTMFVGSLDATFTLTGMTLTALPSPSGSLASAGGNNVGQPGVPVTPPQPAARHAPPAPATLAAELEKARAIYEDDLKKAAKPEQKAAVARNIVKVAGQTDLDATARYVLLDLARKVFVLQAGEVKEALDVAAVLEKEYELPPDELSIATIEALGDATLDGPQRAALATAAIDLAEALLDDERFEPAGKLAILAVQSASKQKDADLRKKVLLRKNQLVQIVSGWEAVKASQQKLADSPDDPAANLAVGKFRCLVLEDWERGPMHLAKGSDAELAAAAKLDSEAAQGKPELALAAAEAWLELAKDSKTGDRDQRQALQRRAKSLLEEAVPKLSDLSKVKAERKLVELKDVAAAARPKAVSRRPTEMPGLAGRVYVRNRDAGILVGYLPDYSLSAPDFEKLRAAAGMAAGEPWRIELAGQFFLPVDSRVEVWHAGGSSSGGVHTLYIDAKQVSQVGNDQRQRPPRTIMLPKGTHKVVWMLSGGDMGTAAIRITPVGADGTPQPGATSLVVPRELDAVLRQPRTKSEIRFGS